MLRIPLLVALTISIAFGLGIGSTIIALKASSGFGSIRLGAWVAFPYAQSADADPYARSHRANAGKLLYGIGEGLSFQASQDDEGNRLSPNCSYELSGQTPLARFFTLYATDNALEPLIADNSLPSAFNSQTILRHKDGSFSLTISPDAAPGNWLAIRTDQPFRLALTLFDSPTSSSSGVIDLTMPKLQKIGCRNA